MLKLVFDADRESKGRLLDPAGWAGGNKDSGCPLPPGSENPAEIVMLMKKPPLRACAVVLLAAAALAVIQANRPGLEPAGGPGAEAVPAGPRESGSRPGGIPRPTESPATAGAAPAFRTDEQGIVDTADYDADQDGLPEIATFVRIYRMLKTSAGKHDMLQNVRILEPPDDPVINELIITEAARSEDPEIRSAARDALFEYGGKRAGAALADYIATQTGIHDLEELKRTLDKTGLPPLNSASEDR
jgi:hypothetical protein